MIQRIQSVYLLLAVAASYEMISLPLFKATLVSGNVTTFLATESLPTFAIAIVVGLLALVTIFLFKNRKLQMKLLLLGILLSAGLVALVVYMFNSFGKTPDVAKTSYSWGALLPIAMFSLFILAWSNIRKDEKLIKSLDRLR